MPIGKAAAGAPDLGISDGTLRLLRRDGRLAEESMDQPAQKAGSGRFSCTAGIEQCFIGADGKVYACHYFQNLKEPMGDLSRSSLAEIHRAGSAASITHRFDWGELRNCGACAAFAACRGGCRARAKLLAGDYYAPDPFACRLHLPGAPGTIG
jgi:radical SAM protein with 4Fe4S-binding SPASM domain